MGDELPQRPITDDRDAWKEYWAKTQPPEWFEKWGYWRTEPEIDEVRQQFLAERRVDTLNIECGIYPFRDENGNTKLTRTDIEWLLATHESGGMRGPVDWSDENQRGREGLDLRGADLRGEDLHGLPLAAVVAGLSNTAWHKAGLSGDAAVVEATRLAEIHLEDAILNEAHLEGAQLWRARMQNAILSAARLEGAYLWRARLEWAILSDAHLEGADLYLAHLEGTTLIRTHLEGLQVPERAGARTLPARPRARLQLTRLRSAFCNEATNFEGAVLGDAAHGAAQIADVQWGSANLAVVDWSKVDVLGDELATRRGVIDAASQDEHRYERAVRANRQLATALRDQGLNEDADRFAYRAQVLQQNVLWRQGNLGRLLFAVLLWALAGYGYRLRRILIAYALVLVGFTVAYALAGVPNGPHLTSLQAWEEAFLVSFTAIHGRVFFGGFQLLSLQTVVAGIESVFGIVIEGVFTAMLVQRFFGGR